ncbi:MAG: hypothetical protein IPG32_20750 [Saprospirales bacterium]|nr:hypothetical protein [Saprospirales bacterium]
MKKTVINQAQAIALLKEKKSLSSVEIKFDSTPVEALDAFLLRKNGIPVPDELIWYDDDSIDYSDDPEITDEDLKTGRIKWVVKAEIPLHDDIRTWVKKEKIDLDKLLARLIDDFYNNVKSISKSSPKPAAKKKKKEVSRMP